MLDTIEVVSPARAKIFAQAKAARAPKTIRQYEKNEIKLFKTQIGDLAEARNVIWDALQETDRQLKELRQNLYEAEMQHTPITILPSTGPRKVKNKVDKKAKISGKNATKVLSALLRAGLIKKNEL